MACKVAKQREDLSVEQTIGVIQKLIHLGISSIANIRGVFPASSFKEYNWKGLRMYELLPNSEDAKLMLGWTGIGIKDALQHQYLDEVIFTIYDAANIKKENVDQDGFDVTTLAQPIEAYHFKIEYSHDVVIFSGKAAQGKVEPLVIDSKEKITNSFITLLRSIMSFASSRTPLPKTRMISMNLLYDDEKTPPDYEPEFFCPSLEQDIECLNNLLRDKTNLGFIQTRFSSIRVMTSAQEVENSKDSSRYVEFPLSQNTEYSSTSRIMKHEFANSQESSKIHTNSMNSESSIIDWPNQDYEKLIRKSRGLDESVVKCYVQVQKILDAKGSCDFNTLSNLVETSSKTQLKKTLEVLRRQGLIERSTNGIYSSCLTAGSELIDDWESVSSNITASKSFIIFKNSCMEKKSFTMKEVLNEFKHFPKKLISKFCEELLDAGSVQKNSNGRFIIQKSGIVVKIPKDQLPNYKRQRLS